MIKLKLNKSLIINYLLHIMVNKLLKHNLCERKSQFASAAIIKSSLN